MRCRDSSKLIDAEPSSPGFVLSSALGVACKEEAYRRRAEPSRACSIWYSCCLWDASLHIPVCDSWPPATYIFALSRAELAHLYVRSTYHLFCFCLLLNHFCYAKQLCSKIIKILPKFLYYSFKVFISIGENILQNSSEIYSDFTILKFI